MTTKILSQIEKPKDRPPVCTILADSGIGKTSFAATFPTPVFIRAEDGLQSIPSNKRPDALPVIKSPDNLWEQLHALIKEDHQYKTLVIDSVTALERLFIEAVLKEDPKAKSINQALGGYGNGIAAVTAMHQRLRKACEQLVENKQMCIVFIAHADTETIELPDQDNYTRYCLRLNKKSVAAYVDDSDLVGFMRLETYTHGDGDKKKATSTGARELVCYATAANVSKNRYGIDEPLTIDQESNPLFDIIPFFKNTTNKEK